MCLKFSESKVIFKSATTSFLTKLQYLKNSQNNILSYLQKHL